MFDHQYIGIVRSFGFVMRDTKFPAGDDLRAFTARTVDALEAAPGVEAAGLTTHLPLADNNFENSFTVDGSPVEGVEQLAADAKEIVGGDQQ